MIVEVVYIGPELQFIKKIEVVEGASVQAVIESSGVLDKQADISLEKNQVGIFNELVSLNTVVKENDRVEVYRALKMAPMDARRLRAKL